MNGGYGYNDKDVSNSNLSSYTISVSKYREGTSGNDVLTTDGATATTQVDELAGLGGNDKMVGTSRAERFDGGDGNDTIEAGAGDEPLCLEEPALRAEFEDPGVEFGADAGEHERGAGRNWRAAGWKHGERRSRKDNTAALPRCSSP